MVICLDVYVLFGQSLMFCSIIVLQLSELSGISLENLEFAKV